MYGDDDAVLRVRDALWTLGFCPAVFKKSRREAKAKGVDIAMTKDLLSHAHYGNYDVAVVMTGDGDYVPVIEEVKRLGKVVYVVAFASTGMSGELRLTSDMFFDIESTFIQQWQRGYPSNDA